MTKQAARQKMAMKHNIREVTARLAAGSVIEHDNVVLAAETVKELEADGMSLAFANDKNSSPLYLQDWQGRLRQVFVCTTQQTPAVAAATTADKPADPVQSQPRATKTRPARESGPRQAQV